jgi:heavy metal sensor kinase
VEVGLEDDAEETLNSLLLILSIAYPATLAIASIGGIFLAGRALSPIDSLTRTAQRISSEDLSQRVSGAGANDEVGRLARTLNSMLSRLEQAFLRERQFTADVSHELRTPLTAIKGQVDVTLSRERSVPDYQEALRGVNVEVGRLSQLINGLLVLARADAGQVVIGGEDVRLASVVSDAVGQVRPAASERGVGISAVGGDDVSLRGDRSLLLQLLLNLLDNAVRHTEQGGEVLVTVGSEKGWAALSVSDSGPGVPIDEQERIFDRFYRIDQSRDRARGGAGLGLSICRWIAEAHGGDISVESAPGEGSTFTVRLPLTNGAE